MASTRLTGSNRAFSEFQWIQVFNFVADQVLKVIYQRTASLEMRSVTDHCTSTCIAYHEGISNLYSAG